MTYSSYRIQWLLNQPINVWISLKKVPDVIGFVGIMQAIGYKELLDYGYHIKTDWYVTCFMITKSLAATKNEYRDAV